MPQLHLYVPDEVAETAKARTRAAGKSLSSYLEEVVGGWKGEPLQRPRRV
jgi:hypothetical protein